ncbi:MAG: DUF1616 domain-containing protein [Chloroflexi bacterium]|nr:DUF1616 domain-containing protein [Chloroflexota bacterium]
MEGLRAVLEFLFPASGGMSIVRAALGFALVFFLPGFAWTLVLFRQINVLERIALSFGLSIAIVALSLLALNKLVGLRISGLNSALVIIVVTIIPVAVYCLKRLRAGRSSAGGDSAG